MTRWIYNLFENIDININEKNLVIGYDIGKLDNNLVQILV